MMRPESLVKLVASGNLRTVEEEWLRITESADVTPARLIDYAVVLKELGRLGRVAEAESLAWAALEGISARQQASQALAVAGPFLLALGDSAEIRKQVAELYRATYTNDDGIDVLIRESGIEGGRPVRRALRTLDVCLAITEGSFLCPRDEAGAARVERIDTTTWQVTIAVAHGDRLSTQDSNGPAGMLRCDTLDAIRLADGYRPASPDDFEVMRLFTPDRLASRLHDDPVAVVIHLLKQRQGKITRDELESLLVPVVMGHDQWKKWWTRARGVLKQHANIEITARAPYTIMYTTSSLSPEDRLLQDFKKVHDPQARWTAVEQYIREYRHRKEAPPAEALQHCYDHFCTRAGKAMQAGNAQALLLWLIAAHIGEFGGIDAALDGAVAYLTEAPESVGGVITAVESEALMDLVCRCLAKSHPDTWPDQLITLFPSLPMGSCDQAYTRLLGAGKTSVDLSGAVQQILSSPVQCFDALLWLWIGPGGDEDCLSGVAPVAVLMRILRSLDDARRSDKVDRERGRHMNSRARTVLSARKHERFERCVDGLEPGMAAALRTLLSRCEALGRAVREDLLQALNKRFPVIRQQEEIAPWSQEDVIYVTRAGLLRRQAEIDEHINVKMKENARAIGRAAEHGDLSENSEYKFALEERDLLRGRLAQMNDELQRARVITPQDVPTDHIGIGTKATFERVSDGRRFVMSFVGPWEARGELGLFNYKSPLAQRLMGTRIGDVVSFELSDAQGEYKLVELCPALEE